MPRDFGGLTDLLAGPEWACAAGLLVHGRGSGAATRNRPAAPRSILTHIKAHMGAYELDTPVIDIAQAVLVIGLAHAEDAEIGKK